MNAPPTRVQHVARPIEIREMSKPLGVMPIDCLHTAPSAYAGGSPGRMAYR